MAYINGEEVLFSAQFNGITEIDTEMSDTSENPVENKVIKAYVDKKTAPATSKTYGTVKVSSNLGSSTCGITQDEKGVLCVTPATEAEIDNPASFSKSVITPENLRYAVAVGGHLHFQTIDSAVSEYEGIIAYTDKKTAPATSETYGTVKCWSDEGAASISNGIYMDADGMLRFVPASETAIDSKSNPFAPIVPSNLDYAVKSVGDGYYAKVEDVVVNAETTDNKVDSVDAGTAYAKPEAYPNLRAVYEYGVSRLNQANAYTDEKLAPATSSSYGTVKVASDDNVMFWGITHSTEGDAPLHIVPATPEQIDDRYNYACPIVPSNLDYAVKSVGDGYYALSSDVGDVEAALDSILAMQESLIGGDE